VFNQLTPAAVVTAIGRAAQSAARLEGPASDFDRDQLMSAYSATRHLAAELDGYALPLEEFTISVARSLQTCPDLELRGALSGHAERIASARDGATLGQEIADALATVRQSTSDVAPTLRAEIHAHLRSLADREVDVLAEALGGGSS
jgi:hypothetical protein